MLTSLMGTGAARATHMAWNWREIEALLLQSPCVRLVLCGHDHMVRSLTHFAQFQALLNAHCTLIWMLVMKP